MPGYEGETQRLIAPCPMCGNTSVVWGTVAPRGSTGQEVVWRPDERPVLHRLLGTGYRVRGRLCDVCGNLQLFITIKDEQDEESD